MIRIATNRRIVTTVGIVARHGQHYNRNRHPLFRRLLSENTANGDPRSPTAPPLSSSTSNGSAGEASSVSRSTPPPSSSDSRAAAASSIKYAKTSAGTGDPDGTGAAAASLSTRGPVTWPALGLVAIAAASAVGYYKIERERRLENAMGKIVSARFCV